MRDWPEDDALTFKDIDHMLDLGWPVSVNANGPVGWTCSHVSVTSTARLSRPSAYCGCEMTPIHADARSRA